MAETSDSDVEMEEERCFYKLERKRGMINLADLGMLEEKLVLGDDGVAKYDMAKFSKLTEMAFLMVSAPSSHEYGIENDRTASRKELDKVRYLVNRNRSDRQVTFRRLTITSYGDLVLSLSLFMHQWSNRTKTACVVLSGHCDPEGRLMLEVDSPHSLDTILEDIHKQWLRSRQRFPESVTVVIGTCYSHVYSHSNPRIKDMEVIPVTTPEEPYNETVWQCENGELVDVLNSSLYEVAEKLGQA